MITKMTKEQEAQVEVYHTEFLMRGLNTDRLDVDKALDAIKRLYSSQGLALSKDFEYRVFDSPKAMLEFAEKHGDKSASSYVYDVNWGSIESYWISFYSFINNVLGVTKAQEKVKLAEDISIHCGPFLMFDNAILMSQKPTKIHMVDTQLHCEDGPAVEYADGYKIWKLHNVEVTEKIVMTRPEDFTKEDILNEKNADIRREIVRNIPAEILVKILDASTIDTDRGYELLTITLGDGRTRPFLKMLNPSINTVHIEGVNPECRTVVDAIAFRNGVKEYPATLDGADFDTSSTYHQQGDALFFPTVMPEGVIKTNSNIAAEGLIRHIAVGGTIYEKGERRFLEVLNSCEIQHPEHKATVLQAGTYEIKKVMEYDHWLEESREVID